MTKQIVLAKDLKLPLDAVTQTFGALGRKGSGKTYMAGKLVEGFLEIGAQVVTLDPIGNWWGLRLAADGKGKGYDIPVIGGLRGDVPLEPTAGELVADLIVTKGISAVIDVSQFSKADEKRFVTAFAKHLFQLKKKSPSPLHLVLEEAQTFIPQQVRGETAHMVGALEQIVRLGRNFGIGATLISQRPQSVNKEVLNQVEALFVFQTVGPQERKAIEGWIVEKDVDLKEWVKELPALKPGDGFLWSPQWLGVFRKVRADRKKTFDASATPLFGNKQVSEPKTLSKDDLAALQESMSGIVERAKENDPVHLKRRIRQLEKELEKPGATKEDLKAEYERGYRAGFEKALSARNDKVEKLIQDALVILQGALTETLSIDLAEGQKYIQPVPIKGTPTATITKPAGTRREPRGNGADDRGSLRKGARRMVETLVAYHPRKITKRQLATLVGMKATGGTFQAYFGDIQRAGYATYDREYIEATETALNEFGSGVEAVPQTHQGIVDFWKQRLRKGERDLLDTLIEFYDAPVDKQSLAERVGMAYTGGTFAAYLGTLVNNGLAERVASGEYRASDTLFPEIQ